MNRASRCFVASLVLTAAPLAAPSVAEAIPPLPQTRVDAVHGEASRAHATLAVILADLAAPLDASGNGLGYYARTVNGLGELIGRGHLDRGKHGKKQAKKRGGQGSHEAPIDLPEIDPLRPGELTGASPRDLPESPGHRGRLGRRLEDLPLLPEPLDRPFVRGGHGRPQNPPERPAETPEVREPSGAALFAIGMVGLLLATRRKPH